MKNPLGRAVRGGRPEDYWLSPRGGTPLPGAGIGLRSYSFSAIGAFFSKGRDVTGRVPNTDLARALEFGGHVSPAVQPTRRAQGQPVIENTLP